MADQSGIADVIKSIQDDVRTIVKGELELAKAETLTRPASAGLWELRARAESALGKRLAQHRSLAEVYAIQGNYAESANQLALARAAGDGDFFEQSAVDSRLREVRVLLEEQLRETRQQR